MCTVARSAAQTNCRQQGALVIREGRGEKKTQRTRKKNKPELESNRLTLMVYSQPAVSHSTDTWPQFVQPDPQMAPFARSW